jgi:hypothetical protein
MNLTTKTRRLASALVAVTAGAAVVLPASSASAAEVEVNFDGGTPGAPCNFATETALSNKYAGLGIRFRGPGGGDDGGAILDKCSNFGVDPHSGLRFLAFNGNLIDELSDAGTPRGPETILFTKRQKRVSIWVSQGSGAGSPTFKLVGKRGNKSIRTSTATTNTSAWLKLEVNHHKGFDKVVLSATDVPDRAWVADDLVVRR